MSNIPGISKPVVFLSSEDFAVERVFPIRNLVGDADSTPRPENVQNATADVDPIDLPFRIAEELVAIDGQEETDVKKSKDQEAGSPYLPPPYPPVPPSHTLRRLPSDEGEADLSKSNDSLGFQRKRTERTQLVPATTRPPGVFPGIISDPSRQKFHRCEDEPIHTPGAIQQYGVLLALKYDKDENLEVRIVSENSRWVLEYTPEQLFNLKSFLDILDAESRENIVAQVEHALHETPKELNEDTHLDIFDVSLIVPNGTLKRLWCALHISKRTKDLVILEFEDFSDVFYHPDVPDKTLPDTPTQTIDLEVHPEERLKSITRESAPLRVLQISRHQRLVGVSSMNLFNAMIQAQQQLSAAKSVQHVLDLVVGIISELTGFHRVMFYRFDVHKNGCVEAELVNPQASLDLYRGLHFPGS
ncbi:Light-sensor Protein kinase [Cadophora gregata]|uniref:Light-sensor Protein kinase n=1 Tax=Cadophora gregata TaxID=51156 RepID=UPI0026DBD1F5|nr:Light-sensor Protein kinase [Cadophora gregata]KAK0128852.1 Light-sensor Protein kinase [Cadophora gregata]